MVKLLEYLTGNGLPFLFAFGFLGGVSYGYVSQKSAPPLTFEEKVHQSETQSLRGTEYFNSSFYGEFSDSSNTEARKLKARITEPNRKHLLALLALRAAKPDSFQAMRDSLKAGILIDALNQATYFNAWGVPHLYWTDNTFKVPNSIIDEPVKAIIELDTSITIPSLKKLLTKKRSAPHWGADEASQSEDGNQYRVADYALALIQRLRNKEFKTTRAGCDTLIQAILKPVVN